ncbi:unnamed protein product, partial [Amoebophrya sp. A25]
STTHDHDRCTSIAPSGTATGAEVERGGKENAREHQGKSTITTDGTTTTQTR